MSLRLAIIFIGISIFVVTETQGGISEDLDGYYGQISLSYATCFMLTQIAGKKAELHGDKSSDAKQAYSEVSSCQEKALKQGQLLVDALKKQVAAKPKAETALKEFYSFWRTEITGIASGRSMNRLGAVLSDMTRKLERVRTEAEW